MRHKVGQRKLHRTTSHRLAMLNNMVTSLLEHQAIKTTLPKAKEARKMAERIITLGKRGGLSNVRLAAKIVKDKDVLQKVFSEYKDRYANRPGGYTRIVKLGFRRGDAAEMALLELVDRPAKPAKGTEATEQSTEETARRSSPRFRLNPTDALSASERGGRSCFRRGAGAQPRRCLSGLALAHRTARLRRCAAPPP